MTTARLLLPPMDLAAASSPPPDQVGGDAATVTSSEVSRSSSEVAVTHDPFHPTTTSSWHPLRRPNAIPKAITLTTTVTTPLLLPTTDVLLYQQLQKRLRPEDIPSIPSLSLRNQRRRFQYYSCDDNDHDPQQQQQQRMGTTTTTTTTPRSFRCHRPVCNFVNYLGHDTRMAAATAPPPRSDPDRFSTSLISLWQHDGGNDGRRMIDNNNNNTGHNDPTTTTTTMPPPPQQFASIVTVDDDDHHDMWGWSSSSSSSSTRSSSSPHWEDGGGDWGLPLLLLPGRDIGTDDDDVGLGSWDDPMVTTTTHQHLDDDHNVTALLDPFSLPYGPLDDATDLFDFD